MAARYNVEPAPLLSTLKSTVFKGASDDELLALVVVANEHQLNPFLKEIYAFPAKGGGIVPIVSVDGWNRLANSHPQMDGLEFEFEHDAAGELVSCTAVFHRKDRARPIKVTEYLAECRRNTEPWKMQHRMLRHKALIQGARVAFGFSGLHDEDEARDIIDNDPVANAKPVKEAAPEPSFALPPGAEMPPVQKPEPQPAKPQAQSPIQRDIKTLRGLIKMAGFTELALINLLREAGVDESLSTLEEIGEVNPAAIRSACEPWAKTLEALKAAAKGEQ